MRDRHRLAAAKDAPLTADELETAAILAQADRDCDAGLGLKGADAEAFLKQVLEDAEARVAAAARHG
jgi:hypothetical protein